VLLYFHSVRRDLCGTASQGVSCCAMHFKLAVRAGWFLFSVFPTGLVVRVHLVLGSVIKHGIKGINFLTVEGVHYIGKKSF